MSKDSDNFWLDKLVEDILTTHPEGEIVVSSGVTPSGSYHIGHLREVLTADAVTWAINDKGRKARHIHVVDDFDNLRKIPAIVPDEFERYLGMPIYLVPSPDNKQKSYADYFFNEFYETIKHLTKDMEVVRSHERYLDGYFTQSIFQALENMDSIKETIETVSGRQLKKDWSPIQILDNDNRLDRATLETFSKEDGTVTYRMPDGSTGTAYPEKGEVKLDWRIDWPARWSLFGVDVEPFGRDHATKGSSYDTGAEIVKNVFKSKPPFPVPYEFINLHGQTKKMSSSKGISINPAQALKMMPPAVLRYFVLGSKPNITLKFDPGLGFGRMFDKFASLEKDYFENKSNSSLYRLASFDGTERVTTDVPFNHLVTAFQSSRNNKDAALGVIERSEHIEASKTQKDNILNLFPKIESWLSNWAPDELKYSVKEDLPDIDLSADQKKLLRKLSESINNEVNKNTNPAAQWYHETIHHLREGNSLSPKDAFAAIYEAILGQSYGPKAGWFLSTLEPKWLADRFEQASK